MRYLRGESSQIVKQAEKSLSGLISGKLNDFDEEALRASIRGIIDNSKRILVVEADWLHLLDFTPTHDEE